MADRKISFAVGEFYHVYNRGVDKRLILLDKHNLNRFLQCLTEFNSTKPIGSIYENSFRKKEVKKNNGQSFPVEPLIKLICYAINPNHFHLLLQQIAERGIEKFMHRLGTGFTNYFNRRYRRSGALFQGRFKARHIDSNEYLLRVSVYINLNDRVHSQLGSSTPKLKSTSWSEFQNPTRQGICDPHIIFKQFKDPDHYQQFSEEALTDIRHNKELARELELEDDLGVQLPSRLKSSSNHT